LRLIDGNRMRCPRCKLQRDILEFVPLMQIEEFATQTAPVYKCPECLWVFALRFPEDAQVMEDLGAA
jgi:rubredoxin